MSMSTSITDADPGVMTDEQIDELIAATKAKAEADGIEPIKALSNVPPVAFSARLVPGTSLTDPATFLTASVEVFPVVNPLFHALMIKLGAKQTGTRTYRVYGHGEELDGEIKVDPLTLRRMQGIVEAIPNGIMYSARDEYKDTVTKGEADGWQSLNGKADGQTAYSQTYFTGQLVQAFKEIGPDYISMLRDPHPDEGATATTAVMIDTLPRDPAAVGKPAKHVTLKLCTAVAGQTGGLYFDDDPLAPDLHIWKPGSTGDRPVVTPDQAVKALEDAAAAGYTIVDPTGEIAVLRRALRSLIICQSVPGAPGQTNIAVGADRPGDETILGPLRDGRSARFGLVRADEAASVLDDNPGVTLIAPEVQDVINMAAAGPADIEVSDPDLTPRGYQAECVGLHLATEVGLLNACAPGLGKTATTLWGMQARAARKKAERDAALAA